LYSIFEINKLGVIPRRNFQLNTINEMGKKGPMPSYTSVDDYIANQSSEAQEILIELRKIITSAIPDVIEVKGAKAPTFSLVPDGKMDQKIMIAAYAKFVSFYPFPSTLEQFEDELKDFKKGKGSIQFPFNQPLPVDLIARMVKFRKEEIE